MRDQINSSTSTCGLREPLLGWRREFHLHHAVVHTRHPPAPFGLLTHSHASPAQHAARVFNREILLIPHRFTDGLEFALPNLQLCRRSLVKISLANISHNL